MLRIRRYRLFLAVSVLVTLTLYHLTHVQHWDVPDIDGLKKFGLKTDGTTKIPQAPVIPTVAAITSGTVVPSVVVKVATASTSSDLAKTIIPNGKPAQTTARIPGAVQPQENQEGLATPKNIVEVFAQQGKGRLEVTPWPSNQPKAYWEPQREHFALPLDSVKSLPTGRPKALNKVQYDFLPESALERTERLQKLQTIRESFKHAWKSYSTVAMPADELKPFTGGVANPFMGWGATMVDSLDTLWMMGLKDEFDEAVRLVAKIDFTTSARKDIPLFETVIRYLGGLLAAFDLTEGRYQVLLDKAVELANILMGAFDTPNRIPVTYYHWAPSYASQPHRASTHSVLAELGSLSVEFTRLAQITKESKYYDAVARITDALEAWQMNTTLPGLWPVKLDGSGCKKPEHAPTTNTSPFLVDPSDLDWVPISDDINIELASPIQIASPPSAGNEHTGSTHTLGRRQTDDAARRNVKVATELESGSNAPVKDNVAKLAEPVKLPETFVSDIDCETQGLAAEPHVSRHTYSIGAMADSTYEYFPKEYMLLGGQGEQYRKMYQNAMNTVREKLLYKPMTKDNQDILFVAKAEAAKSGSKDLKMTYEGSHLGCFAGGMFALGSRVFGIPDDIKIAKQLTDGCVWAYDSTATGIMPESFLLAPCPGLENCPWNQTRYYELLDPQRQGRIDAVKLWEEHQKALESQPVQTSPAQADTEKKRDSKGSDSVSQGNAIKQRQLSYSSKANPDTDSPKAAAEEPSKTGVDQAANAEGRPLPVSNPVIIEPKRVLSHEEFVEARIQDERLPSGFTSIKSREYHLRPEAIESVFIMYRLTGEQSWRDKGWRMFNAIQTHTRTVEANSAISDVTTRVPVFTDSMESFWLAETLKYFYLLFSEPSVISLDDYVLNTEAHPFRIPR